MFYCSHNKGFTIPELLISVSIILAIFAFAGINLLRIIPDASLAEISSSFMADAKDSQSSAIMSESDSLLQFDYSIKINPDNYVLFKGSVFNPTDPSNYIVKYPSNVNVSTTFPNGIITFSALSGEIKNFDNSKNQVVFYGLNDTNLTILFNKIGNIYYVNKI